MTLEEAIKHCEDVICDDKCDPCENEHRQLAKWLHELQERRKWPEIIRCKDCKFYKEYGYVNGRPKFLPKCGFNQIYVDSEDFCSKAERRTDGS